MIALRAAKLADPEERAFIRATWSRAFKQSNDAGMIHTDDWAPVMHRQIDRILDRPGARAILAYDKASPTFLYGWIAGDPTAVPRPVVFFTYVKEPYRRSGIGRALALEFGIDKSTAFAFVCRTPMTAAEHLDLRTRFPLARYHPQIVRYDKDTPP